MSLPATFNDIIIEDSGNSYVVTDLGDGLGRILTPAAIAETWVNADDGTLDAVALERKNLWRSMGLI